jgi:hypothetical protein
MKALYQRYAPMQNRTYQHSEALEHDLYRPTEDQDSIL